MLKKQHIHKINNHKESMFCHSIKSKQSTEFYIIISHLFQNFYKYKREDEVNCQVPPFKQIISLLLIAVRESKKTRATGLLQLYRACEFRILFLQKKKCIGGTLLHAKMNLMILTFLTWYWLLAGIRATPPLVHFVFCTSQTKCAGWRGDSTQPKNSWCLSTERTRHTLH